MMCPQCASRNDRIADSRESASGDQVRRRRICNACGHRWTTYETTPAKTASGNVEEALALIASTCRAASGL